MKDTLLVLSCVVLLLTLGGCASLAPNGQSAVAVDAARVGAIETAARRAGVDVYWIQYPRKTVND